MHSVGAFEAKTHFSQLLQRVAKGEQITITHHGHPIAMLVPTSHEAVATAAEAVAQIREFRKNFKGKPVTVREIRAAINEGRL